MPFAINGVISISTGNRPNELKAKRDRVEWYSPRYYFIPLAMLYTSLLVLVPLAFVVLRRFFRNGETHGTPYPPGPKKKFIIGNLLDLPAAYPWVAYKKLGETYGMPDSGSIIDIFLHDTQTSVIGDLISMQALGQTTIIINSEKVAIDLLEKRSRIYSSRPFITMLDM